MNTPQEEEEDPPFFDAQDTIPSSLPPHPLPLLYHDSAFNYHVWLTTPTCVQHRKKHFLQFMNLLDHNHNHDQNQNQSVRFDDTIRDISDAAVTRSPPIHNQTSSSVSDSSNLLVPTTGQSINCTSFSKVQVAEGSIHKDIDLSPLVQKIVHRQIKVAGTMARTINRVKTQWLDRLRSMTCVVDSHHHRFDGLRDDACTTSVERVKVRQNKKHLKELSALYIGQDIQAHQGSILTMKFSQDGHYLATAGEDGVVRVWQVVEDDRSDDVDIPDFDPCCIYFMVNHLSELAPFMAERQKLNMLKSLKKTSDSACVILPPKVFRILEKPIHEFHGHNGEVLDISWSSDNLRLLSSSVDETVCLWRVGSDQCIKVFPHSNYVTCVQFNPVDDDYFISGSIDGKVRIWSIGSSQVVDWTDIREIITAVTYTPDGKGGIIGSMTGCCRFFSLSDNRFQLEASVCLNSKKKWPCKRISGFQFCPQDASKVMVTCADSRVRILHGINVIAKYKGPRNSGNQLSASFTSDGKHIVSACEDSNIYVWKCSNEIGNSVEQQKTVRSFECFSSDAASVALPWCGLKVGWKLQDASSPCAYFCVGEEEEEEELLFVESIPKGWWSATWPEEKLRGSSSPCALGKSEYKFFKSCWQSMSMGGGESWGLVIVTAGWDGRIRSFLNYGLPVRKVDWPMR